MILIVDDEDIILNVSTRVLEKNGYETVTAQSVAEGLRRIEEQGDDIELAIVDYSLPDGEGWQICEELWLKKPGTKALLSSGYPIDETPEWLVVPEGLLETIDKPFGMQQLLAKVQEMLKS